MSAKSVILTGDRPTGRLHLGHFVGSLQQRIKMQNDYQQYILIADLQALTDNGHNPQKVTQSVLEVMADYLAVGLDPNKTTFCLQSELPALPELTMYYMNLVTISRLERNPTVKAEIQQKGFERSLPAGFLTYPVSQAADITAFRAEYVPVGDDQLPMLEQTNEIVRKFNSLSGREVLTECKPVLGKISRLPGADGSAKMSKSLGNAIQLASSADEIKQAVMSMYTDPTHLRVEDPGNIEGNVVFTYLDAFHSDLEMVAELKAHYQRGGLGDMKCKRILNDCLQTLLEPIRTRREEAAQDPAELMRIIREGTNRARDLTGNVLSDVKKSLGLDYFSQF